MKKLLALIPGPWKWAAGGFAALVLIGGLTWLVHDWRASAAKIAGLEHDLKEERALHLALENQYRAQIDALAQERRAADERAVSLGQLQKGVNEDAKTNDRPAGPLLRNYLDRLHRAHEGKPAP